MYDELTRTVLLKLGLNGDIVLKRPIRGLQGYTVYKLIYSILSTSSIQEAATSLGYSDNPLKQSIRQVLLPYFPDRSTKFGNSTGTNSWRNTLLKLIEHKLCWSCKSILPYTEFYSDSSKFEEVSGDCSRCHTHRTKLHKLDIRNRTPIWEDLERIRDFYLNCPEGMHVDHIIPLRGRLVSGLHTVNNLQYLSVKDNLKKGNNFIP